VGSHYEIGPGGTANPNRVCPSNALDRSQSTAVEHERDVDGAGPPPIGCCTWHHVLSNCTASRLNAAWRVREIVRDHVLERLQPSAAACDKRLSRCALSGDGRRLDDVIGENLATSPRRFKREACSSAIPGAGAGNRREGAHRHVSFVLDRGVIAICPRPLRKDKRGLDLPSPPGLFRSADAQRRSLHAQRSFSARHQGRVVPTTVYQVQSDGGASGSARRIAIQVGRTAHQHLQHGRREPCSFLENAHRDVANERARRRLEPVFTTRGRPRSGPCRFACTKHDGRSNVEP